MGTKYHFFGHIETWAQRDVGTKRCFDTMYSPIALGVKRYTSTTSGLSRVAMG